MRNITVGSQKVETMSVIKEKAAQSLWHHIFNMDVQRRFNQEECRDSINPAKERRRINSNPGIVKG